MAKISLSPLVVDIRGKQSDTVFSKWRGINYIRSRVTPGNPNTEDQQELRQAFADCVSLWQNLPEAIRTNRSAYASGKNFSGYNSWMKDNIMREMNGELLILTKLTIEPSIVAFEATTGEGPHAIDVRWTKPDPDTVGIMNVLYRPAGATAWENYVTTWDLQHDLEALPTELCGVEYEVYGWIDYQEEDVSIGLSATSSDKATPSCP